MKILIVSEFFPTGSNLQFSGGVEARNFFVAKYLAKTNQVTVLTTKVGTAKKREKISGINVVRVGNHKYKANSSGLLSRARFVIEATKVANSLDPDLVEGTNFLTHYIAYKIAQKQNIPAVAWYPDVWVGNWIRNVGMVGVLGEILERFNLTKKFDAYIAISQQTAKKLAPYSKKPPQVIACGIDPKEFLKKVKKTKIPKIICISRLVKYKNVKDVVLAAALLKKEGIKVTLEIIGRGPEKNNLMSLVKNLKANDTVTFSENINRLQLVSKIKESWIFVLTSSIEGFGIAAIESASAGLPSVLSGLAIFKETTRNWQGSLTTPPGQPLKLKHQIEKLLKDKKLYKQKSNQALKLSKNYHWQEIANQTLTVYRKTVSDFNK